MKLLRDREFVINRLVPFLIFLIAIYFPVFMHVGNDALGMWDESLYALRALYMELHGEYLINFDQFEGGSSHPNTKPPFFTLIQVLFFRFFGYSELSLRLPVAITVLLMLLFMVYFSWKEFKSPAIGIFAALVLITSPGFVANHISRTADHDAVLAFMSLLVIIFFYKLLTSEKYKKYIWLVSLLLAISVLTKSVAGLFPLPAMFLFALYKKKLGKLLSSWHTWAAFVLFLLVVGSFYVYREWKAPGFLHNTWMQDIGGRYSDDFLGHVQPWNYYLKLLYYTDFVPWLAFIPLSIVALFTKTGKKYREISLYLFFVAFTYLVIISNSDTKLAWYHAAMFPLMSIVVGIGINWILKTLQAFVSYEKKWVGIIFTVTFVALVFTYPYISIIEKVDYPSKKWVEEQYGEYISRVDPDLDYSMVHTRYVNTCVVFYAEVLNQEGKEIKIKNTNSQFQPGEILMCPKDTAWMKGQYEIQILEEYKDLALIKVLDVK